MTYIMVQFSPWLEFASYVSISFSILMEYLGIIFSHKMSKPINVGL